jgi:uncharacterized protein (DUF1501 family)
MHFIQPQLQSRRAFLRRAGQLAFTGAALPTAINLAAMGEAAAFNASGEYKALVCVFLYGGNDYANTLVPYDAASYAAYQSIRGTTGLETQNGIALARADLTPMLLAGSPTSAIGLNNLQYAMHPTMTGMRDLYAAGKAAVLLNCGPLIAPITKTQYQSSQPNVPPKLFSHNDQQSIWQSSSPEGSTIGWGGNIGDLAMGSNGNSLFTCISVTGNAVFLSGDRALSYQVGSGGAVRINSAGDAAYPFGFQAVGTEMKKRITASGRSNLLEAAYNSVATRAVEAEVSITSAISPNGWESASYLSPFNSLRNDALDADPAKYDPSKLKSSLSDQLRMVARLINARTALGNKRQVFMVSLGGFDLHDNLIDGHKRNMARVGSAVKAFHDALGLMGAADKVTTFTTSEFGRTLSSNGDGSDHGWGGHQIIVGDAVKGGAFYGYAPPVSVAGNQWNDTTAVKSAPENQFHVGQGRLLPTTSVDQYASTLAKWFGVQENEMTGSGSILPFLDNFGGPPLKVGDVNLTYAKDLGFMKPA